MMQTTVTVQIYNWNCLKKGLDMVLDVDSASTGLVLNHVGSVEPWTLVPNLTPGAQSGGYSLVNVARNGSAEQPATRQQIVLGDDPTPFGANAYCWTLWPAGASPDGEQLWAIQTAGQGPAMDAAYSKTDPGTRVLLFGWNGGDNQRWVLRRT